MAIENIGEGFSSIVLELFLVCMAEDYSVDLSEKVLREIDENYKKGLADRQLLDSGLSIQNYL